MIELQTSVKQDDTTRTRTPKPGYLNLSIVFDTRSEHKSISSRNRLILMFCLLYGLIQSVKNTHKDGI